MDALTALLHEDADWNMPPYDLWLQTHRDIVAWCLGPGIGCLGSRLVAGRRQWLARLRPVQARRTRPPRAVVDPGRRDERRQDQRHDLLPRHGSLLPALGTSALPRRLTRDGISRLQARLDPVPGRPRREQRSSLVPAPQGRLRALAEGADGGARASTWPTDSRRAAFHSMPIRGDRHSGSTATLASAATSRPTRRTSPRSFPWIEPWRRTASRSTHDAHGNGGYFNFQPGEMYVGGGMWMPSKARLEALRAAIRDEPDRVATAIDDPGFIGCVRRWDPHPRVAEARSAGLPGRPPDGRHVALEGRHLRPPTV